MAIWLTLPPDLFAAVLMLSARAYSVGRAPDGPAVSVLALAGGVGVTDARDRSSTRTTSSSRSSFFWIVPWLTGRTIRNQTVLARELAEKAERAAHVREEEERRAIALERSRIARELHDVLAHNLSVMVVQASAARRIVDRDPDAGRRGGRADRAHRPRGARRDPPPVRRRPARRGRGAVAARRASRAWSELARRARAAGLRRGAARRGRPGRAARPGIDLTAYRVVQEALTNALKHAGSAHATRDGLATSRTRWCSSIEDDGEGAARRLRAGRRRRRPRPGRHARAGGALRRARPGRAARRGGGFAVRARLPTRPLVPGAELSGRREGAGMSVRVLLVDDQALIRAGFRMILEAEEDIEVVGECADGTQAVDSVAPAQARRGADGHPHAGDGRHRGHAADRRASDGEAGPRVLMLTTFDLDEYVYDALRAGRQRLPAEGRAGRAARGRHPRGRRRATRCWRRRSRSG